MKRQRRVCDVSHPERRPADATAHRSPLSCRPRRFPLRSRSDVFPCSAGALAEEPEGGEPGRRRRLAAGTCPVGALAEAVGGQRYNKALRNMSLDARPKDESAVEMWSTIAYKDPELRLS